MCRFVKAHTSYHNDGWKKNAYRRDRRAILHLDVLNYDTNTACREESISNAYAAVRRKHSPVKWLSDFVIQTMVLARNLLSNEWAKQLVLDRNQDMFKLRGFIWLVVYQDLSGRQQTP